MKPPLKINSSNDFQTPPEAIKPLLPFIKKEWLIWECACGKLNIVNELRRLEYKVIGTDILGGYDFLMYEPEKYDFIITNPPYSIKQEFLERAYLLGKPFAFLLPLTTFETYKRQRLFKEYGIEIIFFDRRINFETPNKVEKSASWFGTAWFCWNLNLPKQLNFVRL